MRKIKLVTFVAALVCAVNMWADIQFNNCYDCQRSPAFPQKNQSCTLSSFKGPYVGNGNTYQPASSTGPWKLVDMGYYNPNNDQYKVKSTVDDACYRYYSGWTSKSDTEKNAIRSKIKVYALYKKQGNNWVLATGTGRWSGDISYGYGIIFIDINFTDNTGGDALLFVTGQAGCGCLLTNRVLQSTDSRSVTVTNDLITLSVQYTVTYNGNGKTSGSLPANAQYSNKSEVTVPGRGNLAKTGYTFTGWKHSGNNTTYTQGQKFNITANTTLTAQWTINQYTITFKNYDGTTLQSSNVNYNTTPSYNGTTPTRATDAAYVYTFSGWSPAIAKTTANATYTAQFSTAPNQETVNDVEALVNAIGTVTYPDSQDKITAARDAYNALTDEQKALVDPADLAALEEAEARYAYLTPLQLDPYEDPKTPLTYYCTFYDGNRLMQLPENVEAYVAYVQGDAMMMQYIAGSGDILPKATPVIFLSAEEHFTLLPQDEGAVDLSEVENDLEGVDAATPIASIDGLTQENCYVISGTAEYGVGFYRINSNELKAHKAYVLYNAPNSGNSAPKRLRFVFNQEQTATGMENVQSDKVQCTKVIENGRLIIIKNGIKYNAQGQEIEN